MTDVRVLSPTHKSSERASNVPPSGHVGSRVPPLDWEERTSGRTVYAGDLRLEGLLVGRMLRSPYPFARILKMDTGQARSVPGVHAVITAADFPLGVRYLHEGAADRPPLADGIVRFVGQEVAAVAAETLEAAEAALRAIRIEWQQLVAPLTIDDALAAGAARLHERPSGQTNVSRRFDRRWGDPEAGRRASCITVEGVYSYPRQNHACMEPNTTVARWDAPTGRLHLWTSTQSPYFISKEVAHVLGLQQTDVICHEIAVGGGFGSKSKISEHEAIAGALARAASRPVRIAFTREEEFDAIKTRHAFRVSLRAHADAAGHLRALDGRIVVDNGAYNHSGVSVTAAGLKALGSLYRPDGVELEALLVDTATQPGGQFRGYGSTQGTFPLECAMDELAERLGRDPIDLRIQNANQPFETVLVGSRIQSARLVECLEAVRDAIGWVQKKAHRRFGRGLGVAVGTHVSGAYNLPGANRSDAAVDVFANGRVRVRFGGSDAGTGQKTIVAQIAAQELGVDLRFVDVFSMDTAETTYDLGAWGSRGTYYSGHAVRQAASKAAADLLAVAKDVLGCTSARITHGVARGDNGSAISIGDLIQHCPSAVDGKFTVESSFVESGVELADPKTGLGNISGTYSFAAHAVEVEVNPQTGELRIIDYVAAHDVGRAINPSLVEGQIIGGVAMGLGAALGEELIYEQGKLVNGAFMNYALPRSADLPKIRPIVVEGDDPKGPYGAKGVGEVGTTPPGPAVANAVYDAIGVRIRDLPITPDKILRALAEKERRRRRHALWRRPGRWWVALVRWAYPRGLFYVLHRWGTRLGRVIEARPIEVLETPSDLAAVLRNVGPKHAFIAGGTDLALQRRQRLMAPSYLVSLVEVRELKGIQTAADGSLIIGAAVTLAELGRVVGAEYPMVAQAVERIASAQIRNMATVGGNLTQAKRCWFFRNGFACYKRSGPTSPCYAILGDHRFYHAAIDAHRCQAVTPSDLATVFVALDVEVVIASPRGERVVAIAAFYRDAGETVLKSDEVIKCVRVPQRMRARRSAFEKLRLFEGDFALVSAAVSVDVGDDGRWNDVRIVLGALAPTPWRARRTERALIGTRADPEEIRTVLNQELDASAHPLPGNGWKLDAAVGLVARAVERLTEN